MFAQVVMRVRSGGYGRIMIPRFHWFRPSIACVLFLVLLFSDAASAQTTLRITRSVENPIAYTPGETVDIRVSFFRQGGTAQVTQLGLAEQIPLGWTFVELVSGAVPQIPPAAGATGQLNFGWINIPTQFPTAFTYRIRAANSSSGSKPIAGRAVYAVAGGVAQQSANVVTLVSQQEGTSPTEGEVTEGEGSGGEADLVLDRVVGNGGVYAPGSTLDLTLTITNLTNTTPTQLGVLETLPAGWSFNRVVSGNLPAIQPNTGKTGELAFAWIFIPSFPVTLTYRVNVSADSTGTKDLTGVVLYSSGGPQEFSAPENTSVSEGTAGEGEGSAEGGNEFEGEPDPDTEVILTRQSLNNGFYTPGQPVEVEVTLTYTGTDPVQQLGLEELTPNGWQFGGFSGGTVPPIGPQPGDTGTLGFAYITVPGFPVTFRYLLAATTGSIGEQSILGQGLYAFGDQQQRTRVAVTTLASTFESEGEAQDGLTMRRLTNSDTYLAGGALDVTVNLNFVGTDPLTTLGFEENLPPNWTFQSVLSSNAPPVVPSQGESGKILFAWIDPPTLPVAVTYRVNVDAGATGDQEFRGVGRYRTSGEELLSNEEVTVVTEPVLEGEGEGVLEGEGGGTEGEVDSPIILERDVVTGNGYTPGDILDVRLTITPTEQLNLLAFGVQETIPDGFVFEAVLDSSPPPIRPAQGDTGALNFAYVIPPALPLNINYRLRAEESATGLKTITGKVQYRLSGPALESPAVATDLPELTPADLTVTDISIPETLYSGQNFPFVATVLNQGRSGIAAGWQDCIYLSTDNVFGNDTLVGCYSQEARLNPNSQYYVQDRIDVPGVAPGNYFLFVRSDDTNVVGEGDETNNVSPGVPVAVESIQYEVTAQHLVRVNNEGEGSIVLRGFTNDFFFGGPVPNVPVAVDLTLHGVKRTFTATTNQIGAFEIPFTPLPTEAGRYSLAGRHPGLPSAEEQDSFTLNLMRIAYDGTIVSLAPNVSQTVTASVENLGETALTSVGVAVLDVPEGITAQASVASSIPGSSSVPLSVTLVVSDAPGASGVMRVVMTNAQNVGTTLFLPYQVLDGVPNFVVSPSTPKPGAVPGQQTLYEFDVQNIGGGTAEGFVVLPPTLPWVTVVAPVEPRNLRAQQTARVVLELTPPENTLLGDVDDSIQLAFGEEAVVTLPITVSVVSANSGGLDVTLTDETTLTTSPDFRVAQASVVLRDPESGALVSERNSTNSGEVQFRNVAAGAYDIEARKAGYGTYRDVVVIDPGAIDALTVVMQRNFTQPRWEVQATNAKNAPAYIDSTSVEVDAPGPQVVVSPSVVDLEKAFEGEATFSLTLTNEGDEVARNVQLNLPDQTNVDFTPLVTSVGDLAAGASLVIPVRAEFIAPTEGESFDCVVAGTLGVSYGWLRGNTAVERAYPIALRLPRVECPDSRPEYGYLPVERNGRVPFTPVPLFVEDVNGANALKSAPASAQQVEGAEADAPPAPRSKGVVSSVVDAAAGYLKSWLPGLLSRFAGGSRVEPMALSAVRPVRVEASLASVLAWEGGVDGGAHAALAKGAEEAAVQTTVRASTGRTRVNEAFDIEVDFLVPGAEFVSNVKFEARFFDEAGLNETPGFEVVETRLRSINGISGNGVLSPGVGASARIRYLPLFRTARTRSKLYTVTPRLTFTVGGESFTRDLLSLRLLVDVQRDTTLQVYSPTSLFGDDPLTPETEPGDPFQVGVYLKNLGSDTLSDVKVNRIEPVLDVIDSGEINPFSVTGLVSATPNEAPGLRADIGSIGTDKRDGAVFVFRPENSGNLVELAPTLSWEIPGRGRRVLLPDTVEQFSLIRAVVLNVGVDDGRPDLLIDTDDDQLPDSVVLSNTNPAAVQVGSNVVVTPVEGVADTYDVTATMPFFIGFLRIPLPPGANASLDRVEKSNGTPIRETNAWVTRRAIRQQGGGVQQEVFVNLVDISSNGRYRVIMGADTVRNDPPVAEAGGDQTVFTGTQVTLEGRGSFDPEGATLTYLWSIGSAPSGSTATLSDVTAAAPRFTPDRRGTYRFDLVVSDGVNTAEDSATVQANNRAPVAQTSGDLTATIGSVVTLDASASSDPEGDPLTFSWTVLSQPNGSNVQIVNPTASKPTVTVPLSGTYVFRVVANDGSVSSSPAEQRVTVINQAPLANAGPDQSAGLNDRILLDGSSSLDPDGSPVTYSWSFVSVPSGSQAIIQSATRAEANFIVDRLGDFVVRLTVSDGITSAIDEVNISTSNSTPVADAGAPQGAQVGDTIELDGSGSFDPDGDSLRYTWTLTGKPDGSTATLSSRTVARPTLRLDLAGNYSATLVVSDGSLSSAPAAVSVSTGNTPPVANAGPDQGAKVGDVITLNGSASSDADGDQMLFIWSFRARPTGSAAALSNPNAVAPRFTVDKQGTYVVELKTFDGRATSAADTVSISTVNTAPTAAAGADRSGTIGSTVTLDGSASSDPDGDTITYAWTLTSKPVGSTAALTGANTVNPSITLDEAGAYVIRLQVNDGVLTSGPDTIVVSTVNSPPTANAGADQAGGVGERVTLDGSGSTDPDGDALTYTWRFTSVPEGSTTGIANANSIAPSFVLDERGTYVVSLVVGDGANQSAPDTVIVSTENTVPVANAGPDQSAGVGATVTLDGSASDDADGDSLTFAWSVVSRPAGSTAPLNDATGATPSITIDEAGDYVVQLIVNDGLASSTADTVRISTENAPPVANAGNDRSALLGQTVILDGTGSTDADGDTLTYAWTMLSKPAGSVSVLSSATAEKPSFVVDESGDYVVRLVVNDGQSDSAPDTIRISTENTVPLARAGANRTVDVGTVVQLDGSNSADPDGNALTFAWTLSSRPSGSAATLANATTAKPSFTADVAGSFVARLVVNDGALSSGPATVTITAVAVVPEGEGEPEGEPVCVAPAAPQGISASDGVFADRVEIQWGAVNGATGYRVWRGATEDVSAATPLTGWIPGTSFNDTTAGAPTIPDASGCQCNAVEPVFQFNFYWVQARSGEGEECESALAGPDRGHRGASAKALLADQIVRVRALPGQVVDATTLQAGLESALYLRATAPWGSVASYWGRVSVAGVDGAAGFESTEVSWLPVPGAESYDGWVVYTPETAWVPGQRITFTAGGTTSNGAEFGPYSMEFVVDASVVDGAAALTPVSAAEPEAGLALTPAAAYETARTIAVPVPDRVAPERAALFYLYDDGFGGVWYPAEQVSGWLMGPVRVEEINGVAHLVAEVSHGGVLRAGERVTAQAAQASTVPQSMNWGDLLAAGLAMLVLVFAARRGGAPQRR